MSLGDRAAPISRRVIGTRQTVGVSGQMPLAGLLKNGGFSFAPLYPVGSRAAFLLHESQICDMSNQTKSDLENRKRRLDKLAEAEEELPDPVVFPSVHPSGHWYDEWLLDPETNDA